MLTIGISWLYITLLCSGYGWIFVQTVGKWGRETSDEVPLSLLPFLGLALISVGTAIISLFAPIFWQWNILFLLILGLGVALCGKESICHLCSRFREVFVRWPINLFLLACFLILLLKSSCVVDLYGTGESVFHSDTGYYHAQSIRWIEEYGVVPGLGNLLSPLAIDYLWFQPCALFSFAAFLPQRLHALEGLLVFWAIIYATGGVRQLLTNQSFDRKFSDVYRALLLIPLFEIGNYVVSDSGDDPAAVMVLISIGTTLFFLEKTRFDHPDAKEGCRGPDKGKQLLLYVSVLLLLFTVGIKLSTLPLLLLVALLMMPLIRRREWQQVGAVLLICACVLVPKMIRTVILSGYLLYPFATLDLFKFDWKMPASVLISEKAAVASMARIRFAKPGVALNGGMEVWFYPWLLKFIQAPVIIALIGSLLIFIAGIILFRKSVLRNLMFFWEIYLTVALGLTYWFILAPDVRFGFGFLASAALILSVPVICPALERMSQIWPDHLVMKPILAILALLLLTGMIFSTPRPMPGDSFGRGICLSQYYPLRLKRLMTGDVSAPFLMYQDPYPLPEMLRLKLGSLEINRPKRGMHCWDAPLPATPYLYGRIELRGDSLKQGFRPCAGPIDGFSGFRLVEEWKELQRRTSESQNKKSP